MALLPTLDPGGRPTPTTLFLTIHHGLRRDARRFPVALRRGGDSAAIAGHWSRYRAILVEHHAHEDQLLFPAVLAAHPELSEVVAELAADHAALDDLLAELDAAHAGRRVDAAADLADRLAALLDRHLDLEEEHLVPIMERDAAGGAPPDAGPRGGFGDPAFQLPWLADSLDPRVVDALLALLPPELREAFPTWRAAYGAGPLAADAVA